MTKIPPPNSQATQPGNILRILTLAATVFLALAGIGVFIYWSLPTVFLPEFGQVKAAHTRSESLLLDRHHEVIHEVRIDEHGRRLDWVPLEEVSPALRAAVLQAEDRRFYQHTGVDWTSLGSAARNLLASSQTRGASTIPMQLVSRLNEGLQPQSSHRSFYQKLRQMAAARALERRWSKSEIFEAYLNMITFRGELQGIAAASAGLFGKKPHGLDQVESLILAALIRSPNAPVAQVGLRACMLAESMNLRVDRSDLLSATRDALTRPYFVAPQAALAPHVALLLLKPRDRLNRKPESVVCTLDAGIQRFAAETLRRQLELLRHQNVHDGAVLVVENKTGDVLAYIGNDGDRASARYVDGVRAPRQAGSTLKPFLYGLAYEQRLLTTASLIDDSPLDVPVAGGVYRPRNYDNHFHGLVTSRTALAASLNVPAVKTLNLVGVDRLIDRLAAFGFRDLRPAEFYGPSLALGATDITLWDLVNAYRALANGGMCSGLRLTPDSGVTPARRVLSAQAAFLVTDILSDRESRSITFSLESPLSTRFWTAVKTGTSKDMRDNWCVGFSDRYTVGVWAGNFSGQPMWDVSGVTGAAPAWVEIMNRLHRSVSSKAPEPPPGVVGEAVRIVASGQSRREWFIRGTETEVVQPAADQTAFRIAYPAAGTIVALDPDIPPEDQKVFFEAEPEGNTLSWILDDQPLGAAASVLLWTPVKGRHTLALVDTAGRIVDSINFEVRGNLASTDDSSK